MEKLELPEKVEAIDFGWISAALVDVMLKHIPDGISEEYRLNYDHNVSEAIAVLPKFQTGVDVNPRFTNIRKFEYTSDMILFDLIGLNVVHGWLIDPIREKEVFQIVQHMTYNQLVEKVIQAQNRRHSSSDEGLTQYQQGMLIENFLSDNASQLTEYGLDELKKGINDGDVCILFRNNHFSTLYRHKDKLYCLVTDQGFRHEAIYWEELVNIEGGGAFCDWRFQVYKPGEVIPFPEIRDLEGDENSFQKLTRHQPQSDLDRE